MKSRNKWKNLNQYVCDSNQVYATPDVISREIDAIIDELQLPINDAENPNVTEDSLEEAGKMFMYMYFCPNLPPSGLENRLKVVFKYILMNLDPRDIVLNLKG